VEDVLAVVLFGGAFFVFACAVASRIARPARRALPSRVPDAIALLNERYARGEIDRDEYLERRAFIE
jgi:uncharacterized membrane protein